MLEELIAIHQEVMSTTPIAHKRYLYDKINWKTQAICLLGGRGVGKTTLMCQYLLEKYQDASNALYLSADNVYVVSTGLFAIARDYFKWGGKALFIDEVHKYPDWQREIKNIIDTYRKHQIVFSGSSSIDLIKSKYDLSRRVVYYELKGLSFREYILFSEGFNFPVQSLQNILENHVKIADSFKSMVILKTFKDYLQQGYFPFFLEGKEDYITKVFNIIEKIIFEDIAVVYNLRQSTLPILKKIIWLVATSKGLSPNIDRMSKNLSISREMLYHCLDYLDGSGLLTNVHYDAKGMKLIRKPGKIFIENTSLLCAIHADLKIENDIGGMRETFLVNQLMLNHRVNLHDDGDFLIDGKWVIEVGGKSKDFRQIQSVKNSYLAVDSIEVGIGKKIPLYLFGFLY